MGGMTLKRMIRLFLLTVLAAAVLALPAWASSVSVLSVNASVDQEAVCTVTATVELYLDQSTEELQFTMPAGATGGTVTGYSAKKKDGMLIVSQDGGFIGTNTFQMSWTVPATVEDNTDDVDDDDNVLSVTVTIPLQGPDCIWTVDQMNFQVSMPAAFTETPSLRSGYSGNLNAEDYTLEVSGTVISGTLTGSLIDHEAISLILVVPSEYFSVSTVTGQTGLGQAALIFLLAALAAAEIYRRKRLRFRTPEIRIRVQPPENVPACAVPFLLDGSDPDPAVLLAQWGCLGYVTITRRGRGIYMFRRRMAMGNERRDYEADMFHTMFAGSNTCLNTDRAFRRACAGLGKPLRRYWVGQAFEESAGSPALFRLLAALCSGAAAAAAAGSLLPTGAGWTALALLLALPGIWLGVQMQKAAGADRWRTTPAVLLRGVVCALVLLAAGIAVGEVLICLAAIAVQLWAGYVMRYGACRTERGCELLEQLLGLRRFLLTASPGRLQALLEKQPQYFHDILPYAEALGVGRKFAGRFADTPLENPDWLHTGSQASMTPLQFYTRCHTMLQSIRTGIAGAAKRRKRGRRN